MIPANTSRKYSNSTGTVERAEEHGLANLPRRDAVENGAGDPRNVGGHEGPRPVLASEDGNTIQTIP